MRILTVNSGSSSIKFSVYEGPDKLASGKFERIGLDGGLFTAGGGSEGPYSEDAVLRDHEDALRLLFKWLKGSGAWPVDGVGHRIVHGGERYSRPNIIDGALIDELETLVPFAAEHLPHEIKAIKAVERYLPGVPQVACFDTAFHAAMPEAARTFALPFDIRSRGVVRYGFHGLSYEYIIEELKKTAPERASGNIVVAHLGNGASMCAVKAGQSIDTTMGFTPLGGLVMSTRTGDLDPGVIVYMLKTGQFDAEGLNDLLNKRSGLLGISGISPDMADLLEKEGSSKSAALAVEVFCYQARKYIGALAAALGGIDTLVFTAGIGENSPVVRARILDGLGFIGIRTDMEANGRNAPVISSGPVKVMVMKTDEEVMIARHAFRALERGR